MGVDGPLRVTGHTTRGTGRDGVGDGSRDRPELSDESRKRPIEPPSEPTHGGRPTRHNHGTNPNSHGRSRPRAHPDPVVYGKVCDGHGDSPRGSRPQTLRLQSSGDPVPLPDVWSPVDNRSRVSKSVLESPPGLRVRSTPSSVTSGLGWAPGSERHPHPSLSSHRHPPWSSWQSDRVRRGHRGGLATVSVSSGSSTVVSPGPADTTGCRTWT